MAETSSTPVACCCCETCENQEGDYHTDEPTVTDCPYGSSQVTITTASGCSKDCWECDEEKCEDLGSYYTEEPTCPTGMNKSQTTVTSVATDKTYTCWQCMFDFSGCDPANGEYDNASACPPASDPTLTVAVPITKYDEDDQPYTCYKCEASYSTPSSASATSPVGPGGSSAFTG
jgi:hypothetical protein